MNTLPFYHLESVNARHVHGRIDHPLSYAAAGVKAINRRLIFQAYPVAAGATLPALPGIIVLLLSGRVSGIKEAPDSLRVRCRSGQTANDR
jgi:hypothetical protein